MARKKVISYGAMATMAVAGGLVSIAAVVALWLLPESGSDGSVLDDAIGTVGVIGWFLGSAAGVLAASTPFARRAIIGLSLCGVTLVLVVARAIAGM